MVGYSYYIYKMILATEINSSKEITYGKVNRLLMAILAISFILVAIFHINFTQYFKNFSSFIELVLGIIIVYIFLTPLFIIVLNKVTVNPEKKALIIRRTFRNRTFSFDEIQKCKLIIFSLPYTDLLFSTYFEIQTATNTFIYPIPPKNISSGIQANATYYQKIFEPIFGDLFQTGRYVGSSTIFRKIYWKCKFADYLL
jgi:hypothetical protein